MTEQFVSQFLDMLARDPELVPLTPAFLAWVLGVTDDVKAESGDARHEVVLPTEADAEKQMAFVDRVFARHEVALRTLSDL